jgi:hypothetical protein
MEDYDGPGITSLLDWTIIVAAGFGFIIGLTMGCVICQ